MKLKVLPETARRTQLTSRSICNIFMLTIGISTPTILTSMEAIKWNAKSLHQGYTDVRCNFVTWKYAEKLGLGRNYTGQKPREPTHFSSDKFTSVKSASAYSSGCRLRRKSPQCTRQPVQLNAPFTFRQAATSLVELWTWMALEPEVEIFLCG